MDREEGKDFLCLDVHNDKAARSIMHAYLHARGVVMTGGKSTKAALKMAQRIAGDPDPELETASQTWEMCRGWATSLVFAGDMHESDCTIEELEMCMGGTGGFEIAAVVLRKIPDYEKDRHAHALNNRRRELERETGLISSFRELVKDDELGDEGNEVEEVHEEADLHAGYGP